MVSFHNDDPAPPALQPSPPRLDSEMEDWQPPLKQDKGEQSLLVVALFPRCLKWGG